MDDATAITLIGGLAATVIIILIAKNLERRRRHPTDPCSPAPMR
jgi:hypothetical protein